jgi:hypothetical protein
MSTRSPRIGHAFAEEELPLFRALRQASVGADDPLPGQVFVGLGEHQAHEARSARVDVAVGAHKPLRDRADALDDPVFARHSSSQGSSVIETSARSAPGGGARRARSW